MASRVWRFILQMKRETIDGTAPIIIHDPNHRSFLYYIRLPLSEHKKLWANIFNVYISSWKRNTAKDDERWKQTLDEQKEAMQQIAKDTAWATESAPDSLKNLINEYVFVYKDTIKQFGAGYREGINSSKSFLDILRESFLAFSELPMMRSEEPKPQTQALENLQTHKNASTNNESPPEAPKDKVKDLN